MKYRLSTLRRAENDVARIYRWLAKRSPVGAVRWHEALDDAIGDLTVIPLSFGFADEPSLARRQVRQRIFKTRRGANYRILFMISENQILVLRVRGPGQPPVRGNQIG